MVDDDEVDRITLPGDWYLVKDKTGVWYLSEPDGVWVATFWDGPAAGERDTKLFAASLNAAMAKDPQL